MLYRNSNFLGELGIPQAPHSEINVDRKVWKGESLFVFLSFNYDSKRDQN